jgi:hypothetical protein
MREYFLEYFLLTFSKMPDIIDFIEAALFLKTGGGSLLDDT